METEVTLETILSFLKEHMFTKEDARQLATRSDLAEMRSKILLAFRDKSFNTQQ